MTDPAPHRPGGPAGTPSMAAADAAAPRIATQSAWLERFYDLVLVSSVTHFATRLGSDSDLRDVLGTLGWLAGLWLAWFLVTTRLNRIPDDSLRTRAIVIVQLLALTVGAASAVSTSTLDRSTGIVAVAVMSFAIAVLYRTAPANATDASLIRMQVIGNSVLGVAVLLGLVLPIRVGNLVAGVTALAWSAVVLLVYMPAVARSMPVRPDHAANRYGQLFTVLLGLSFLTVAYDPTAAGTASVLTVAGALAAGVALWTLYIDGVLPYGFPTAVRPQIVWLASQLLLAVSVAAAAAGVRAVPASSTGTVTAAQAWLEAGALAGVLAAMALLAAFSQRPARGPAVVRAAAALVLIGAAAAASLASEGTGVRDNVFSAVLAAVLVAVALLDTLVRRRGPQRRLPHT